MSELKKIYSNYGGQTPSTGKEVEDAFNENFEKLETDLVQLAGNLKLDSALSKLNIRTGHNLLNRNYLEPSNPFEFEKGGKDRLINGTTGIIYTSTGWYVSPLIEWKDNLKITASQYRAWAQYEDDGITPTSINFPAQIPSGSTIINKDVDAKYIRLVVLATAGNIMLNYGETSLPYEPYEEYVSTRAYGNTPLYFYGSLQEMLLSESYYPVSPTYTDGLINSPVSVVYPDGGTGQLTLTRTDGLVTKIVATKIIGEITITTTMNITRDADGNVTNITFN